MGWGFRKMSDDTNTEHGGSFEYAKKHVLRVYVRETDRYQGELVQKKILDLFENSEIAGATVFHATAGFGGGGEKGIRLYKLSTEHPIVVECIDDIKRFEPLLPDIKELLGEHGIITLTETEIVV